MDERKVNKVVLEKGGIPPRSGQRESENERVIKLVAFVVRWGDTTLILSWILDYNNNNKQHEYRIPR